MKRQWLEKGGNLPSCLWSRWRALEAAWTKPVTLVSSGSGEPVRGQERTAQGLQGQTAQVHILPLPSYVTLGRPWNLSEPQFRFL